MKSKTLLKAPFLLFMLALLLIGQIEAAGKLLINMDLKQADHLKAYGVTFWALKNGYRGEWLLNYRGGSFLFNDYRDIKVQARMEGVTFENVSAGQVAEIYATISERNMEIIKLEKAPQIAVYTPESKMPWDDAVTMALSYANIPYDKVFDKEVLFGTLDNYDWLHLHHEDFTGQYSKFFPVFHRHEWYRKQQAEYEAMAKSLGFLKVSNLKKSVALAIRTYVEKGGFLFAMCCAPNTLDMALASMHTDICPTVYDGDPIDPGFAKKLDYDKCFAFKDFKFHTNASETRHGNIDVNMVNTPMRIEAHDFTLFDFSAKYDPVPSMLVQNHVNYIKGFFGLATSFNRKVIKKNVTILAEVEEDNQVRYMHGNIGRGQFTFYGGHDPEDYAHEVGSEPTDLSKHKNSPGYRLILNNVLFPSARKKKLKT